MSDIATMSGPTTPDEPGVPAVYAVALHFFANLPPGSREELVVASILDLFQQLFSPARALYLPLVEGLPGTLIARPEPPADPEAAAAALRRVGDHGSWQILEDGFRVPVGQGTGYVGVVELGGFASPGQRDRYLAMALDLASLCGFPVVNARMLARLQAAQAKLGASETRYRALLRGAGEAILILDGGGRIIESNSAAHGLFGLSAADLARVGSLGLWSSSSLSLVEWFFREVERAGRASLRGVWVRASGGRRIPVDVSGTVVESGTTRLVQLIVKDMTERVRAEEELRARALVDELTGLYNRRGFVTVSEAHLRVAKRSRRSVSLAFVDVDGMKEVNDGQGHAWGDQLLKDMADLLRKTFRESDVVARMGGDEFAVLAPDVGAHQRVTEARLDEAVRAFNASAGRPYQVSYSIGWSSSDPAAPKSMPELLEEADQAMYRQKAGRRSSRTPPPELAVVA